MTEILDIVNENDEVIGQIDRELVTDDQITRRVFIGFYTPDKKIILQKRSMKKKTNPGRLTVTVSGHVESGMSYDDTAVKEALEESGIAIDPSKLVNIGKFFEHHTIRTGYAYPYDGDINDLKIEPDEGEGFILMDIPQLRREREDSPEKFSPFVTNPSGTVLIDYIESV